VFQCKKCKEISHVERIHLRGNNIHLKLECARGHRVTHKISKQQVVGILVSLLRSIYVCLKCGSDMTLIHKNLGKSVVRFTFICPYHGRQTKDVDYHYHTKIDQLKDSVDSTKSIIESMFCRRCGQSLSINEIHEQFSVYHMKTRCSNGHSDLRYLASTTDSSTTKKVLQQLLQCDKCELIGKLLEIVQKGKNARVVMRCPTHGQRRKLIPLSLVGIQKDAIRELPKGELVESMLDCGKCRQPLAIRSIERKKDGFRIKTVCRNGHTSELTMPIDWGRESIDSVVGAVLKCKECDLITSIMERKVGKKHVEISIVCPIHGVQKKGLTVDISKHVDEIEKEVDLSSSIEIGLTCEKCDTPLLIRKVNLENDVIKMSMECRNAHRVERFFSCSLDTKHMVEIFTHAFECTKCHESLDLVAIESKDQDTTATLQCLTHGNMRMKIPTGVTNALLDSHLTSMSNKLVANLIVEKMSHKLKCEFTYDEDADALDMLDIVAGIIDKQELHLVSENKISDNSHEIVYIGRTEGVGSEFVVVGSVMRNERAIKLQVHTADETTIVSRFKEMRDKLRETMLRLQKVTDDVEPIKIVCAHCAGPLDERGLPGETTKCPHCDTPLHWT